MDNTISNGFKIMDGSASLSSPTQQKRMPNALPSSRGPKLKSTPASCALCRRRKVRCDKSFPCSSCVRAGVECVPRVSSRIQRGRQGGRRPKSEGELLERIAKLESLIKDGDPQENQPLDIHSDKRTSDVDNAQDAAQNLVVTQQPVSKTLNRYVGTSFWITLSEEISGLRDVLDDSSNDEDIDNDEATPDTAELAVHSPKKHSSFIFLTKPSTNGLVYPTRHQIYVLCEVYLANVDPVFKVLHAPSLRRYLQEGTEELDCSPGRRGLEPLKCAIYFAAVLSLSDGECQHRLGADRTFLLSNFRSATENALADADFLNIVELSTLQALAIYLVAVRANDSSRMMWTLVGLAVRIAQGMGLNIEQKSSTYSLFHREMRRRLWWQICTLDIHAADDRALNPMIAADSFNTPFPLAVNDEELHPESSCESVHEQDRYTDMTFCLVCHEIFDATRQLNYVPARQLTLAHSPYLDDRKERISIVMNLQRHIEEKYTRHLKLSVPFHWAARLVGDLIVANMWLWIYRPLQRRPGSTTKPHFQDPGVLCLAIEVLEKAHQLHIDPAASSIRWLSQTYVQWHALAVVAAELCVKTKGPTVERGWAIMEPALGQIVQNIADSSKGMLWRPIKKLIKRAQIVRETYLSSQSSNPPSIKLGTTSTSLEQVPITANNVNLSVGHGQNSPANPPFQIDRSQNSQATFSTEPLDWNTWYTAATSDQSQYTSEIDQMAWANWEDFVGGFQWQGSGYSGVSPSSLP